MTQQTEAPKFVSLPYEVEVKTRRFEGQVAMVHGGAQGLGRVTARRLAQEGARVVIADIKEDQGSKTASEISAETEMECVAKAGDLSIEGVADDMVGSVLDQFGRLDVLINTAAYQMRKPLLSFTEEMLQKAVAWNMWNTLRACKAVLPGMMERKYGRVVNLSSGMGQLSDMNSQFPSYRLSKTSLNALTRIFSEETAGNNVLVNSVCPGWVRTGMGGTAAPKSPADGADYPLVLHHGSPCRALVPARQLEARGMGWMLRQGGRPSMQPHVRE